LPQAVNGVIRHNTPGNYLQWYSQNNEKTAKNQTN